jgi:hypothetical protein
MNSLRTSALLIMLATLSISIPARAQQDVNPDHYDEPVATAPHDQASKNKQKPTAAQSRANKKPLGMQSQKAHARGHARRRHTSRNIQGA